MSTESIDTPAKERQYHEILKELIDVKSKNRRTNRNIKIILEDVDEQIALCDEIIETQQEKKEKLQRIKNEILENMRKNLDELKEIQYQ